MKTCFFTIILMLGFHINIYAQSAAPLIKKAKTSNEICSEKKLAELKLKQKIPVQNEAYIKQALWAQCAREEEIANSKNPPKTPTLNSSTPVKPAVVATLAAVVVGPASSSTSQAVIGGCGTPEQCQKYMAEAAIPKYTWGIPVPFLYGPVDAFSYAGGGNWSFEQPESACNKSNQGQLIAVDFGTEVRAMTCMGPDVKMEDLVLKIKNAKVDTLPTFTAVKKAKYIWEVFEKAPPNESGVRICSGPGSCEAATVGKKNYENNCDTLICIRVDGGPVKTTKKPSTITDPSLVVAPEPDVLITDTQKRVPAKADPSLTIQPEPSIAPLPQEAPYVPPAYGEDGNRY